MKILRKGVCLLLLLNSCNIFEIPHVYYMYQKFGFRKGKCPFDFFHIKIFFYNFVINKFKNKIEITDNAHTDKNGIIRNNTFKSNKG